MHDLMLTLLETPNTPKAIVLDECSTHFDARTNQYEVANQWTPAAKRFAKLAVSIVGIIGHTGKDIHPEAKRLTTTAIWKNGKDEAEFYEAWPADADRPVSSMFTDPVNDFSKSSGYDPDDAAPWNWDFCAELFSEDLPWEELYISLREHGLGELGSK